MEVFDLPDLLRREVYEYNGAPPALHPEAATAIYIWNGESTWRKDAGETFRKVPKTISAMSMFPGTYLAPLLAAGSPDTTLAPAQEDIWHGRLVFVIQAKSETGGGELFFDPQTHLLVGGRKKLRATLGAEYASRVAETEYSDFRPVGRFVLPRSVVSTIDGRTYMDIKAKEFEVLDSVDPQVFVPQTQ